MFRTVSVVGVVVWLVWAFLSFTEIAMREGNEPISIVGQMFFSWGLAYAIYVFILLWFLGKFGLKRYQAHMDKTEKLLEEIRDALKSKGENGNG